MKKFKYFAFLVIVLSSIFSCTHEPDSKPNIYIIGDSTVKCGKGIGEGGLWGWGAPFYYFFDTAKVEVHNMARGGTSSRTYRSLGLWQAILDELKAGDFVFIQFGHNDGGALNDSLRARGTIRGTGDESELIDNILTGERERVYTFGAYLRMYVQEIKEKGAKPVLIAPIPRNRWGEDGKIPYNDETYGGWTQEVAKTENVKFINLNHKLADAMNALGPKDVTDVLFFERDHTHLTAKGAVLAATLVVDGISEIPESELNMFLVNEYPGPELAAFINEALNIE